TSRGARVHVSPGDIERWPPRKAARGDESSLVEMERSRPSQGDVAEKERGRLTARSPPTCGIAAILAGASLVLSLRLVRLPADLPLCGARERRRLPERLDEAL